MLLQMLKNAEGDRIFTMTITQTQKLHDFIVLTSDPLQCVKKLSGKLNASRDRWGRVSWNGDGG